MKRYWSTTKFADKIRGTVSLTSGTSEEWKEWRLKAQEAHPVRFWVVDTAFDEIQNFVCAPVNACKAIKRYTLNRFVDKTHALSSNLPKGQWYDFDTRVVNCLFDEMVKFIEVENACSYVVWNDLQKEYGNPYKISWRSAAAGRQALVWASSLTENNIQTRQAEVAKELLFLWDWWAFVRPSRVDIDSIEQIYSDEDEEMMIRLISIRGGMWT